MIQLFKKQIAFNYIYLIKLKVSTALDMNTILKFTNSELRMLDRINIISKLEKLVRMIGKCINVFHNFEFVNFDNISIF